jgi:hypothetical protein
LLGLKKRTLVVSASLPQLWHKDRPGERAVPPTIRRITEDSRIIAYRRPGAHAVVAVSVAVVVVKCATPANRRERGPMSRRYGGGDDEIDDGGLWMMSDTRSILRAASRAGYHLSVLPRGVARRSKQ